ETRRGEQAEPPGHGERQVEQRRLPAHRQPDLRQLRLVLGAGHGRDNQHEPDGGGSKPAIHGDPPPSSTRAQSAKPVMSLKVSKSTLSLALDATPRLRSARAVSIVRATRKISVVG